MTRTYFRSRHFEAIEEVTTKRIREYEAIIGAPVSFPVPLEKIVEQVIGLDFDWDVIEEIPGEQILGGLDAANRKILLNEKHIDLFKEKPGLLRSTIGHETGHWDIDIDRSRLLHPCLPGLDFQPLIVKRQTTSGSLIEILKAAMHDERVYQLYKRITSGQDAPDVARAVNEYQSSLLMPSWLMKGVGQRYNLTRWSALYELAKEAQVTISNLMIRLQRLGLIYIPDGGKQIYRSKDEYTGQGCLF